MGVIYTLTNVVTGKKYVGKTMIGAKERRKQHSSNARIGHKSYLYKSMRKYGDEKFVMEVVDYALLQEELDAKEIAWIAKLDTTNPEKGYNCTIGGDGAKHGPSSRVHMKGRIVSEETRAKMAASQTGRKMPPEVIAKLSALRRGKKQPLEIVARRTESTRKAWTPEKRASWSERMKRDAANRPKVKRIIPQAQRDKQSQKMKGRQVRLGIKNSPEANRNVSTCMLRVWEKRRTGELETPPNLFGKWQKPHTEEAKYKRSERQKTWWAQHPEARGRSKQIWTPEKREEARKRALNYLARAAERVA